jgi:hypothetical protein
MRLNAAVQKSDGPEIRASDTPTTTPPFSKLKQVLFRIAGVDLRTCGLPDLRTVSVLMLVAAMALPAAEIDASALDNPRAIPLPDRAMETRWTALFQADPAWVSRQVAYLAESGGAIAPTLLAARLVYHGEPWSRRGREEVHGRRWKASDLETRLAVLREIRWRREASYAPVLGWLLTTDDHQLVLGSALATLWFLDSAAANQLAAALADPRLVPPGRNAPLPGSGQPAVRQLALALLMQMRGPEHPATAAALGWALTETSGAERVHALALIEPGTAQPLLRAAVLRLAEELAQGDANEEVSTALTVACTRLGTSLDPHLADALVRIAVAGQRAVATAAASALAGNLAWTATVPTIAISARANADQDPAVRHALRNLLLRVDPRQAAAGDPASAWTSLGAHRERLARWEWERYAK